MEIEECRHCRYKFRHDDQISKTCPVCSGTRDRYDNYAKMWNVPRDEAKARIFEVFYGTGAKVARQILRNIVKCLYLWITHRSKMR